MAMLDVRGFYDALVPWYHLVYQDWEASIARQGQAGAGIAPRQRVGFTAS